MANGVISKVRIRRLNCEKGGENMKIILIIILLVIGFIGLSFGIKLLFFPVNTAQKLLDTAYRAQDKILNADNAIYNYEWFKQQKFSIEAGGKQLENAYKSYNDFKIAMPAEREKWSFEDKTEDSRLRSITLGLENNLQQIIANYNARAQMASRNIFIDNILPSYIDALTFIKK